MKLCYIARDKLLIKPYAIKKHFLVKLLQGLLHLYVNYIIRTQYYAPREYGAYKEIDQRNKVFKVLMILALLQRRTT